MKTFRKRPVEVKAIQFQRDEKTIEKVKKFFGKDVAKFRYDMYNSEWEIKTLEGNMRVHMSDWIVRGVRGEYYPVREDIFNETYEAV